MKKKLNFFALIFGIIILCPANTFAVVEGDTNNSGTIDLRDAIIALQGCTGKVLSYIDAEADANGDSRIGLEEAIFALQFAAGIRNETIWYKDADGDGYSDDTAQLSHDRPSDDYYKKSELMSTYGDSDDNNADIHPGPTWVAADDSAKSGTPVNVDIPVSNTEEVVVDIDIPGINMAETDEGGVTYQILELPGGGHTEEIGKPQLPTVGHFVAVPAGASVNVEIVDSVSEVTEGYTVYPAQEPLTDSDNDSPTFTIDTEVYETDAFYPSEIVEFEGPHIIRGCSMIILKVFPVQFNPVKKTLKVYSSLRVRVSFEGEKRYFIRKKLRAPSFDKIFHRLLLNAPLAGLERDSRAAHDEGDSLLIITHPDFESAANTLMDWKVKKGISTEVRTTNETGNTAPAIQTYIQNAYDNWDTPPTYVLFIGDSEFIPCHYVTNHPSGERMGRVGTDLYYATVDGDDYLPDISTGRLSVDTLAQATTRINDIIGYERAVVTDAPFYRNVAVCAEFQDRNEDNRADRRFAQTSEDIAIYLSDPDQLGGKTVNRIYGTPTDVTPRFWSRNYFGGGPAGGMGDPIPRHLLKPGFAWDGDANNISNAVNNGCFLVTHRDHGNRLGWGTPSYNTGNVQALTNGNMLPVVWSINCQTGWFDNETDDESTGTLDGAICFSETWERNTNGGAVGVIAATRNSYSGHNDRLVWGWTDAIWPDFNENYSPSGTPYDNPVWEMGPVLNYGKYYYAAIFRESNIRRAEFEMFHWFGDPTMRIWTEVPQNLSVSHPSSIQEGATSVDVTVDQPDALICVSKDGEILAKEPSVNGVTTVTWSSPLVLEDDVVYITVTKHNCRPYEGTVFMDKAVDFPDTNLEAAIREAISKLTGDILVSDLQNLTSLSYSGLDIADEQKIKNLEGIQYCSNLTELDLRYNQISDISAVANLNNLTEIDLSENQISDISAIANLTNLTVLILSENQISNISAIANLNNLMGIVLDKNPLNTISCIIYIPQLESRGVTLSHDCNYEQQQPFTNSLGMTFVLIPAGTFMMGSPKDEPERWDDETLHQVTLTKSYYMQTTEVTQGQWEAVMGSNPSYFSECGDNCPVEEVSWNDAQEFISKMNQRGEGTYRLPTEAEWEYAARAGSTTAFANGGITETGCGHDPNLNAMGWYCGNSDVTYSGCYDYVGSSSCAGTHPVAQKQANAWGLYDTHGNVCEWCQDWYGDYPTGSVSDPTGSGSGSSRVYRDGSWTSGAGYCRSACRNKYSPVVRLFRLGFRLALSPSQ